MASRGVGPWDCTTRDFGWELIHLLWRCCWPLPPLRRPTFFLEKVGKTARSCIRPYAALRVPSLRHLPGPRGLRLAAPSLRLAFFGYAEGAAQRPLQAPPLSLLKSQFAASVLVWIKSKIKSKIKIKIRSGLARRFQSGFARLDFEDASAQAPPVTLRLQEAEWRCLEGGGCAAPFGLGRSSRVVDRDAPGGHRSEGTRSAAQGRM